MRAFFESEMNAENAHRERWREGLDRGRAAGGRRALRGGAGPDRGARATTAPRSCAATTSAREVQERRDAQRRARLRRRHRPQRHPHRRPAARRARARSPTCRSRRAFTATSAACPTCSRAGSRFGGFMEKLRDFWWHRIRVDDQPRGLYSLHAPRAPSTTPLERFEGVLPLDPIGACRTLYLDLLWPLADEEGKPGLVEMSSHNVQGGADAPPPVSRGEGDPHGARRPRRGLVGDDQDLGPRRRDPRHRLVGRPPAVRSIAASPARRTAPAYGLPADRFHLVVLDDLVAGAATSASTRFAASSASSPTTGMRAFFDGEMSASGMHRGRWAEGAGTLGRARVSRRYERTLVAARSEEGNHVARASARRARAPRMKTTYRHCCFRA